MVKKPPSSPDLEGRDVQAPIKLAESDSHSTAVQGNRGRILLSMVHSEGTSYAAILIPESYLEAMAMAVDAFHVQIVAEDIKVTDLVLKLGMKSSSGAMVWAPVRSEQWSYIVRDGDELRMGRDGAEFAAPKSAGPLVSFKSRQLNSREKKYSYRATLLPRTSEELKTFVRREFKLESDENFHLKREGADAVWMRIPLSQWLPVIREMVKEDPMCEVLVVRYK
ncbi:hypothetical protein M413DRAFT_448854 [Hebeloma cylindrosporum]|uniref:Uncharacterized protein n=1 Tax=Hebeloma cylindrosporum TaxID=76867 RepID=A0A0C3BJP3_HEBCY|nr:hypothetical protein M413DRAFT_448854 [Hebeloma cylindrosporum h7]